MALIVEYDGASYHGFQYQANASSIQEEIEKSIAALTGESVRIRAAGRTDAGVHAEGQVVAFDTSWARDTATTMRALNHYLPEDIAVKAAFRVGESFDPRRSARSRLYRYNMLRRPVRSPLRRRSAWLLTERVNLARMRDAARLFEGEHDFVNFAGPLQDEGASTVRRICSASLRERGDLVEFEVEGNAFLPHQMRRMAGALVNVGKGKTPVSDLEAMIDGRPAAPPAPALPPHGLCLVEVKYADFPPR
jgi:tRNA pseudouridine38-40 synthase